MTRGDDDPVRQKGQPEGCPFCCLAQ